MFGKNSKACGEGWKSDDGKTELSCKKRWTHPTPVHTDKSGRKFVVVGNSLFTKPDKKAK